MECVWGEGGGIITKTFSHDNHTKKSANLRAKSKLTHPILQIIAIFQIHLLQPRLHHAASSIVILVVHDFQLFQSTHVFPVGVQPVEHDVVGAHVTALPDQPGSLEILQIVQVQVLGVIEEQEVDFLDRVLLSEYPGQRLGGGRRGTRGGEGVLLSLVTSFVLTIAIDDDVRGGDGDSLFLAAWFILTIPINDGGIDAIARTFVLVVLAVVDAILLLNEDGRNAPLHPGEAEYRLRQIQQLGGYLRRINLKFERRRRRRRPPPLLLLEEKPTEGNGEDERRVAAVGPELDAHEFPHHPRFAAAFATPVLQARSQESRQSLALLASDVVHPLFVHAVIVYAAEDSSGQADAVLDGIVAVCVAVPTTAARAMPVEAALHAQEHVVLGVDVEGEGAVAGIAGDDGGALLAATAVVVVRVAVEAGRVEADGGVPRRRRRQCRRQRRR